MNKTLIKLITHYESLHDGDLKQIGLQPKMDSIGIWTEGWGHAILNSSGQFVKGLKQKELAYKLAKISTVEEADAQLASDLNPILAIIKRKIKVPLDDNQTAALASFIYNTGGSATLFSLINSKSSEVYNWWTTHYITAGGKKLRGLVYRRKSEALLFSTGELKFFN